MPQLKRQRPVKRVGLDKKTKTCKNQNQNTGEYSDEDPMSDLDFSALEEGQTEEEFWARKLGLTGNNTAVAKERLAEEYSKDGLGDDFLELFDFMDEVRDKASSAKQNNTAEASEELEVPKKYVPPHRRESVTSSDGTVSVKSKQSASLLGLLNRVSEGNLDSISIEIISLLLKNKCDAADLARALVCTSCDNGNITVTLQGTFAAIACAVAVETAPSNQFSGCLLAFLVSRVRELVNAENSSRIVANLVRFTACLFSMGLLSVDVVESLLNYIVSLSDSPTERKLEWILTCLRYSGRVLRDQHKTRFFDMMDTVIGRIPASQGMQGEFALKELKSMREGKSSFRAVDHLQSVSEWLAVRSATGKPKASSDGSTLSGWKVPRQVQAVQLVVPTADVFNYTFPSQWTNLSSENTCEETQSAGTTKPSLEELAAINRMTTEVKKSAFIAIMGAVDSKHAMLRLDEFSLLEAKNVPSIVSVLTHCTLQESSVNPFYVSLLQSLCTQLDNKLTRKFRISFKIEFSKLISCGKLSSGEINVLSNLIAVYISASNGQVSMEDILRGKGSDLN